MKNNTEKLEETTININVRTGLMHNNKADEAHTRITFAGFYINAMNYFVRLALDTRKDMGSDEVVFENDVKLFENLQYITTITEAFSEWLPDYASDLAKNSTANEMQALDLSEQSEDCQRLNLAVQISEVLRNPNLPVEMYNAILHGADDIVNTSDLDACGKYETSPEHIKAV